MGVDILASDSEDEEEAELDQGDSRSDIGELDINDILDFN